MSNEPAPLGRVEPKKSVPASPGGGGPRSAPSARLGAGGRVDGDRARAAGAVRAEVERPSIAGGRGALVVTERAVDVRPEVLRRPLRVLRLRPRRHGGGGRAGRR